MTLSSARDCLTILPVAVLMAFGSAGALAEVHRSEAETGPAIQATLGALGQLDGSEYEIRGGLDYILAPLTEWRLRPSIGGMITENGAYFIGVGIRRDFYLSDHWVVTPSFGPGLFEESEITELGHDLEFRSGLELGYRAQGGNRFGIVLQHLSNAGLGDENPGRETVSVFAQIPL